MGECAARIVRRVNKNALNLSRKLLFQSFKREQIVAEDEAVIEEVVVRDALLSVIRLVRVFEQDARLQPGPVLLPNPRQFQFLLFDMLKTGRRVGYDRSAPSAGQSAFRPSGRSSVPEAGQPATGINRWLAPGLRRSGVRRICGGLR